MHLKLINGIVKKKPNYRLFFSKAYLSCLIRIMEANKEITEVDLIERKRVVYYGVNLMNHQREEETNEETLMNNLSQMDFIKAVISTLTPDEFENIFPIEKTYDGDRFEIKDYFYTKKALDEMGRDKEIGDNVEDLLWDYQHQKVRMFNVMNFSILSDIRRYQGKKGIMEEFFEEKGLPTYKLFKDEDGKQYMENSLTGEVAEVKKPKPRYLNAVK